MKAEAPKLNIKKKNKSNKKRISFKYNQVFKMNKNIFKLLIKSSSDIESADSE